MKRPFLCIITPVFDPALLSFKLLVAALKQQTCKDFLHVAVSNGRSPLIENFIADQDPRFTHTAIPEQDVKTPEKLIANLGQRREHCLKAYDAARFLFLDADLKILRDDYFAVLLDNHLNSEILLTKIQYQTWTYPFFPIDEGRIDIANYSFSNRIAKKFKYPTDYQIGCRQANDYRFYAAISEQIQAHYVDIIFAEKDGNNLNSYVRVSDLRLQ